MINYYSEIGFGMITIFFNFLIIKTKYDVKFDALNKICIFLMYSTWGILPFLNLAHYSCLHDYFNDDQFNFENVPLKLSVVFVIIFILWLFRCIHLVKVILYNTSATNNSNSTPQKLLTDNFYKNARHPMFGSIGVFLILWSILWGSYTAIFSVFIWFVFFYRDAIREENSQLIPLFGKLYLDYKKQTPNTFFDSYEKMILIGSILIRIIVISP